MRILVVSNLYPPAVRGRYERECRDVVEHLRADHEVTVLTSELGRGEVPGERGVVRRLPFNGDQTRLDAVLAPVATAQAIAVVRRALRHTAPDVVFLWNGSGIPAGALRVLQQSGVPLLVRVCEYWFARVYSFDQYTKWLSGRRHGVRAPWGAIMRSVNRLPGLQIELGSVHPVAVSYNSEYTRAHAQPPDCFRVVMDDVTLPSTARLTELDGVHRDPLSNRILFVDRLEEMKGPQVLIRALAHLRDDHGMDATLHLVGAGSQARRVELTELAQRYRVGDQVHYPGPLDGRALDAEIAKATVWCAPAVWDEPFGLTAIEAAICRVPAVVARAGGAPEGLAPGTCALYHERDDAPGCAAVVAETLRGGEAVTERVENAYRRARELAFPLYLERIDRFLADGVAALTAR